MKTMDQNDVAHPTNPLSDHEAIEKQRVSASPLETAKKAPARSDKQSAKQDLQMPGSK